jgi:hypothetical protein
LGSSTANSTIEAHASKGVNHVDYYPHGDKPYILTTSDDRTIKGNTKSRLNKFDDFADYSQSLGLHDQVAYRYPRRVSKGILRDYDLS